MINMIKKTLEEHSEIVRLRRSAMPGFTGANKPRIAAKMVKEML